MVAVVEVVVVELGEEEVVVEECAKKVAEEVLQPTLPLNNPVSLQGTLAEVVDAEVVVLSFRHEVEVVACVGNKQVRNYYTRLGT